MKNMACCIDTEVNKLTKISRDIEKTHESMETWHMTEYCFLMRWRLPKALCALASLCLHAWQPLCWLMSMPCGFALLFPLSTMLPQGIMQSPPFLKALLKWHRLSQGFSNPACLIHPYSNHPYPLLSAWTPTLLLSHSKSIQCQWLGGRYHDGQQQHK